MTDAGHLKTPEAIMERSFALIDGAADVSHLAADVQPVAQRLVHATGDPEVVRLVRSTDGVVTAAAAALAGGRAVLVDSEMLSRGIMRRGLPAATPVICTLGMGTVAGGARRTRSTRSAAAVDLWVPWLADAVVAIGNAPTALFRLLEGLGAGWPRPAAILGFPVGFVGAAEAKDALAGNDFGVPFLTLSGRAGGSAMAAAAVNAVAQQVAP